MKIRRTNDSAKIITITAERLSDNSRITFTITSDKTIKHLRTLLNHHLPPYLPDKFYLYSYQRGALIHFHPPSFKLDYFPVIFDQSVLLLKMDDRIINNINLNHIQEKNLYMNIKKSKFSSIRNLLSSTTMIDSKTQRKLSSVSSSFSSTSSSSNVTCSSILKQIFHVPSTSIYENTDYQTNILTY